MSDPGSAANALFEHAPISLWEQDFSQVKAYLDDLRVRGVTDLRAFLNDHPEAVEACMARIIVVDVNRATLELFRAASKAELLANLGQVFRGEMRAHFAEELAALWGGQLSYEMEGVNYALTGEAIDIHLQLSVLPGHEATLGRLLVSINDIRDRRRAERAVAISEAHFRGLFENAPISLWEEDYSGVKAYLEELRAQGVSDLRDYLEAHPEAVQACMARIRVIDVNRATLDLFRARSKADLLGSLDRVFRDEMRVHFAEELIDIWDGRLVYEGEGINYTLSGDPLEVDLRWSILPGHEATFDRALVSLSDITARKKAEAYLKYLGTHDVLTGLYNRAYFEEERARLEGSRRFPVSIIIADLDGLKRANDGQGHEAGDALLRRAGEVLRAAFRSEDLVARAGGDEFAVIMPNTSAEVADQALRRIRNLIDLNNTYYQGPALSLSLGAATGERGRSLLDVQREADDRMYVEKRAHHRLSPR